jgi:hypothetical protein
MAFTPLAVTTTLGSFKTQVRAATGAIDPQTSGLLDLTLNDLAHQAVTLVRMIGGKVLDPLYSTQSTAVTEAAGLVTANTLDMVDGSRFTLYDSVDGDIPILDSEQFYGLKSLYSSTDLANGIFAHLRTKTDGALTFEIYRGSSETKDAGSTTTVMYFRNPVKATAEATKIDLPEAYMPMAIDVATVMTFRLLGKVPPTDLERRVKDFISMKISEATPKGGR